MILPCEIPQLDIPDVGKNHIIKNFLVTVRKIISVQEIYSDSLFVRLRRSRTATQYNEFRLGAN